MPTPVPRNFSHETQKLAVDRDIPGPPLEFAVLVFADVRPVNVFCGHDASDRGIVRFSRRSNPDKGNQLKRPKLAACMGDQLRRLMVPGATFTDNDEPVRSGPGKMAEFEDIAIAALAGCHMLGKAPDFDHLQWEGRDNENAAPPSRGGIRQNLVWIMELHGQLTMVSEDLRRPQTLAIRQGDSHDVFLFSRF
jgi:hypothetical protein